MQNLIAWDFVEEFSPIEAALLIEGTEPSSASSEDRLRVQPIIEAMKTSYELDLQFTRQYNAEDSLNPDADEGLDYPPELAFPKECLGSIITNLVAAGEIPSVHLENDSLTCFQSQKFTRFSLRRWLEENGRTSIYPFGRVQAVNHKRTKPLREDASLSVQPLLEQTPPSKGPWPWGAYTTKNLDALASAVEKFWIPYVTGKREERPVAKEVCPHLIALGVTNNMAEAISTVIRKEGLPPGPTAFSEDVKNG